MASATNSERVDGLRRRGVFAGALASAAALIFGRSSPAAAGEAAITGPIVAGAGNVTEAPTDLMYIGPPDASALRVKSGNELALLGAGSGDIAGAVNLTAPTRAGGVFAGDNLGAAALSPGTIAFLAVQGRLDAKGGPVDVTHNPAAGWFRSDMGTGSVGISMNNIGVAAVSGGPWKAPDVAPMALWARGIGASGGIESNTDQMPAIVGESKDGSGVIGTANGGSYETSAGAVPLARGKAGVYGIGGGATPGTWGLSEQGVGAWGQSGIGVGVLGQNGAMALPTDVAGGLTNLGGYPPSGVLGIGRTPKSSGVIGWIGTPQADASYPPAGVLGVGNQGMTALWGVARGGGIGDWGVSDTGVGVLGQTGMNVTGANTTPGAYPPSGVLGVATSRGSGVIGWKGTPAAGATYPDAAVLGVGNQGNTGTWGLARGGGIGGWGQSDTGIGISGESGNIGAWFKVGMVKIDPKTLESAAVHTTAMGKNVSTCARAEMGVALMAETTDPAGTGLMIETPEGGVAIHAIGRFVSSEIMLANVPRGADMVSLQCNEINAMSHVSINLRNDVGAVVSFVELRPGLGIVVHFDKKTKAPGTLTYAVSEMMAMSHQGQSGQNGPLGQQGGKGQQGP